MSQRSNENAENATLETLSRLLGKQHEALVEAAGHARCLQSQLSALALHSGPAPAHGAPDIEEIDDPKRARALLESVAAMAKQQIRVIQPSAAARHLIADWLSDDRYGREGDVRVRTIHQSSLLQSARAVSYLERLTRRGVHVRVAPLLPFRLIMADETFGLVCPPDTMLLIRQPALLQLLCRMFEFCWDDARDLQTAAPADRPQQPAGPAHAPAGAAELSLSEQQLVILRLWAKGRQDADIARELQVSSRTLRRMVSALLRRLGVSSRFEAGVVAARTHRLLELEDPLPLIS